MIGKTISHYKIIEKLGGGGMGIVYKAQDLKLDRFVALKFLPPYLSSNELEKQRFIHEAKAASALDHSNICTIFEIGETKEGQLFIVMAYYEGETLKEKIKKRPLPLKEVVDIATQIATGLSKAHEVGIIHRDVKPANVIITKEGDVKIVDFGLAKLSGQTKLTKPGSTLGTISYMSPEQLRGEKTDSQSDIWSLGVVMYEMITGQLPFKGDYEQAITYAILNEEPEPITALRTGVPLELEGIIIKALAKDPKQRYQHVDEIPVDLVKIETRPTGTSQISRRAVSGGQIQQSVVKQKVISWRIGVSLLVAAMVITITASWLLRPQLEKPVIKFIHTHYPGEHVFVWNPVISPDGTKIVYYADPEGVGNLYLRNLDQIDATPIGISGEVFTYFFSPDSRELCFFADGKLKKIFIEGGPVQNICDVASWRGGAWGDDGNIIFASDGWGLMRVPASGDTPEVIISPDSGKDKSYYREPEMLPGSKAVLYTEWVGSSAEEANIAVLNLETDETDTLITGGARPRYSPTGHIIFQRVNSYFAVPFDARRLKITGTEVLVQKEVQGLTFNFSTNGILVYIPFKRPEYTWHLVDRHGVEILFTEIKRQWNSPRFSPDGTKVAFRESGNIWIHDVARDVQKLLTSEGSNYDPTWWPPDGEKITFRSNRSGIYNIYWKRADGTGDAKLLFPGENNQIGGSWSKDGSLFAFQEYHPITKSDIWVYNTLDNIVISFLSTPNSETEPAFSPDGKWVAYTSDKTGQNEIYITPYPGPGPEQPVSTEGGQGAVWAPNGRELFYYNEYKMIVVPVTTRPSLKLGRTKLMFERDYKYNPAERTYDIHPDGQRFLMVKDDQLYSTQINIVLNWFEVLKEKMESAK